jgi:excisionase family DNA binding protein
MTELLTVPEMAQRLRMSRWAIYDMAKDGRLPAVRLSSRKLLFDREAVAEAIRRASGPDGTAPKTDKVGT